MLWVIAAVSRPSLAAPLAEGARRAAAAGLATVRRRPIIGALTLVLVAAAVAVPTQSPPPSRPVDLAEHARMWADADAALVAFLAANARTLAGVPGADNEADQRLDELAVALDRLSRVRPPDRLVTLHEELLPLYWEIHERGLDLAAWTRAGDKSQAAVARERLRLAVDEAAALAAALTPAP